MARLTQREQEIARLLAQGKRQTTIARQLCLSYRTVQMHVKNARNKTGTNSAFDLALQVAQEIPLKNE